MSDQSNEQNPFTTRRFIFAVIVVGIIVICAVIVIVSNFTGGSKQASPTTALSTASSAPGDADPSTCGLKGYETSSSLLTTPKTTWQLVGTTAAPTDRTGSGPGLIDETGFRSCYAHTAQGALFAAMNFTAMGNDDTMRQKMSGLVQPGPGLDAAEKNLRENSHASSGYRAQVAGFKIGSYDGQSTTVDLALNFSDGQLASLPIKLAWSGGDWKIVLADDGNNPIAPAALQSLGGYIPWAGA